MFESDRNISILLLVTIIIYSGRCILSMVINNIGFISIFYHCNLFLCLFFIIKILIDLQFFKNDKITYIFC